METTVLNELEIGKTYEKMSSGSEGTVYKVDETTVVKVFDRITPHKISTKMDKISILNGKSLPHYATPKRMVVNEVGDPIGYTMEFIIESKIIGNFNMMLNSNSFSLRVKIEYLQKLQKTLEEAHKQGLTVLDIRSENIIFNQNEEVIIIDTDNFKVGVLEPETLGLCTELYLKKISPVLDIETDRYNFGVFALELLYGDQIIRPQFKPHTNNISLYYSVDMIDIPLCIKEEFKDLFATGTKKRFIGDALEELKSDDDFILKRIKTIK